VTNYFFFGVLLENQKMFLFPLRTRSILIMLNPKIIRKMATIISSKFGKTMMRIPMRIKRDPTENKGDIRRGYQFVVRSS